MLGIAERIEGNMISFFGALKNKGIDWDKKEKSMDKFRKSFEGRLEKS